MLMMILISQIILYDGKQLVIAKEYAYYLTLVHVLEIKHGNGLMARQVETCKYLLNYWVPQVKIFHVIMLVKGVSYATKTCCKYVNAHIFTDTLKASA